MSGLFLTLVFTALVYEAPNGWEVVSTSSSMRLAQWRLEDATPGQDAEVVLFFFGESSGGSVEANLTRWYGQFEQPDGSPTEKSAKVDRFDVGPLRVTRADIGGTYVAQVRPGASERHRKPEHRMIAAVIEGEGGPWFLRLLGPKPTVDQWEESFDTFLRSLSPSP